MDAELMPGHIRGNAEIVPALRLAADKSIAMIAVFHHSMKNPPLVTLIAAAVFGGSFSATSADLTDSFLPMFKALPDAVLSPHNELTDAKIDLGRMLFYDKRMSRSQKLACNSCHFLDEYGNDHVRFSSGHNGAKVGRNAPVLYNAALHISQFWDGRSPNVEEQAKGPVLSHLEMAMPSGDHVVKVLKSITGYAEPFQKAFPGEADPVTFDNFGKALGAFERKLLTPSRWDEFLKGKKDALTAEEKKGFETFATVGCVTCHNGTGVGGHMHQKLGLVKPWPGAGDLGRFMVTQNPDEKFMFKVPSLRNITESAPYLHDGSVAELATQVKMMAEHQLGRQITDEQVQSIITFLKALKGKIPEDYIKKPQLPPSGPDTPKGEL